MVFLHNSQNICWLIAVCVTISLFISSSLSSFQYLTFFLTTTIVFYQHDISVFFSIWHYLILYFIISPLSHYVILSLIFSHFLSLSLSLLLFISLLLIICRRLFRHNELCYLVCFLFFFLIKYRLVFQKKNIKSGCLRVQIPTMLYFLNRNVYNFSMPLLFYRWRNQLFFWRRPFSPREKADLLHHQ